MGDNPDLGKIGQEGTLTSSDKSNAESEQRRLFEREEGAHKRSQRTRNTIHYAGLGLFAVAVIVVVSFVFVWAWHILAPDELYFVTEAKLNTINAILLSIVGSSFLTGYGKNWLGKYSD